MLSVPSGPCDFHIRCWQGGDVCQAKGTAAFTLFSYELRSSSNYGWSPFTPVLLSCSSIPVFSAWHCVLPLLSFVATRILGHAGGWHLRRKPCVFPFLFLLDFSVTVDFCNANQAAIEQIIVKRHWNVKNLLSRKNVLFELSHVSGAYTVLDCLIWVHLRALENHDVLLHCDWFLCVTTTIQRTCWRLFRCVTTACAPMHFLVSLLHLLGRSLAHDRLGLPMEAIVDDSFNKAYVEDWVFQVADTSDLILRRRSGRPCSWNSSCYVACSFIPRRHRDPRFLLLLRNATRHHCLRCRLDPHVNV